ncbi:MAG: YdeI/OmpD-associated family protein [Beijerinckiaceae bacterium]|nr:YdeI/OmpD-associated family protein [Beijerinckiaceae bacterium]
MIETDRFEKVEIESLEELRSWLAIHHTRLESVWLVRYKKTVPEKFVDRLDVIDERLCHGWVDGLCRKLDETRTMQLISPRRQQAWAKSYKDRVARLEREGRIHPAGLASVARAKASGSWEAYSDVDALQVPEDLRAALAAQPAAKTWFDRSAPSYRRNLLRSITVARTGETRQKRIAEIVRLANASKKVPQM